MVSQPIWRKSTKTMLTAKSFQRHPSQCLSLELSLNIKHASLATNLLWKLFLHQGMQAQNTHTHIHMHKHSHSTTTPSWGGIDWWATRRATCIPPIWEWRSRLLQSALRCSAPRRRSRQCGQSDWITWALNGDELHSAMLRSATASSVL